MIDAYEIGVQLALHDGVSAGLEVIGRELAEVDRAVAVTSAGLQQLARTADTAVKTVSAVAGARTPGPSKAAAVDGPVEGSGGGAPRPAGPVSAPVAAPIAPAAGTRSTETGAQPSIRQPATVPSAATGFSAPV